ncbi:NADH-quinone oxidoreductase subunit A [candidate division KSB1 bacterium]
MLLNELDIYLNVFLFLAVGILLVVVTLILSRILHPKKITEEKLTTYECGEDPVGDSWIRFNNRFYIVALVFIIFSIEIVFLFPWAIVYKKLGMFAFIEMMVFIAILLVGYVYVWVKGDLEWVKSYFTDVGDEVFYSENE